MLQQYDKPSAKINAVLKDLGFVCNSDKMYTFYPSQIYYYKDSQKHITRYGQKSYIAPKPKNSIGSSDGYNQNGRHQKPIRSKTYLENNHYNKNYKIENHHQNSKIKKTYSNQLNCQKNPNNLHQDKQLPVKYWSMRHLLFTNFDRGILLDTESFYSVCPEVLSYHIAKRCKNNIVLDPFCGAGGNIIQLAKTCKRVIGCDIDPDKIRLARHNAEIYGVAHKIDFVVGDFFQIYPKLKADVVFMSPPWGGPGYSIDKSYSLTSMCENYFGGGFGIFDIVKTIAPNIAFHMPKTTNLLECMWLANDFGKVEIQQNIINGRLNSITAFYGDFH
ncbi:trimethylguanosine synthase-like [Metopolophium dirhodum]|uniref:trimethylguanosine synthase-like n=1 Tax=Metopolophium dirhodum TaxID=44670 RepID=UPI00298F7C90|nr:trimethylguanosine synthase-like [Metopolophium dirhodum]